MHASGRSPQLAHSGSADPLSPEFVDYDPAQTDANGYDAGRTGQVYNPVADHSAPGSPVLPASDGSAESGSSGTRVDGQQRPNRETVSSEGDYDNRQSALISVSLFPTLLL